MHLADRLLTIVITATLTSAGWILYESGFDVRGSAADRVVPASRVELPMASGGLLPANAESPVPPVLSSAGSGALIIPVAGIDAADLRDNFADTRDGGIRQHAALDIMAPRGTPVVSVAPGTVEKLSFSTAGGNTVYLRSTDRRTIYYYAHLDGYAAGLAEGRQLAPGEVLGTVGSTGNASPDAPHLHFAIMQTTPDAHWWEPAIAVNPFPLLTGN